MFPIFLKAAKAGVPIVIIAFIVLSLLGYIPGIPKYWGLVSDNDTKDTSELDALIEDLVVPMSENKGLTIELIEVYNEKLEYLKEFLDMTEDERKELIDASNGDAMKDDDNIRALETCLLFAADTYDDTRDEIFDIVERMEEALSDLANVEDLGTAIATESDVCAYKLKLTEIVNEVAAGIDIRKLALVKTASELSREAVRFSEFKKDKYPNVTCS
jgi:hypothetical protein